MSLPLQYLTLCGYKTSTVPELKKKVGIFLPEPMADALDAMVSAKVNAKEKWVVATAAVLALMELPEADQNEYMRRVKSADSPGGGFAALLIQVNAMRKGKELERGRAKARPLRGGSSLQRQRKEAGEAATAPAKQG